MRAWKSQSIRKSEMTRGTMMSMALALEWKREA